MINNLDTFLSELQDVISMHLPKILEMRSERNAKEDGSYVTTGDLYVQDLVMMMVREQFPQAHIVSEELKDNNKSTEHTGVIIVIDPIDGTENFTSGLPEWGISVSCYKNGKHVASLLGCPEMNLWQRSGQPLEIRHSSRIRGLSSSLVKSEILAVSEGLEYRILGCCVYNMINVIRGSFRSFENPKGAHCWDILGGLNLALEHGLNVTVDEVAYAGEYLPPNRKYRFKIEN